MTYAALDKSCQLTELLEQRVTVTWCHIIPSISYGIYVAMKIFHVIQRFVFLDVKHKWRNSTTLWKVSRLNTVLGLNKEIESLNLRIPSEYRKTRTRNNSVFGHFHAVYFLFILYLCYRFYSTIRSLSRALLLKKASRAVDG